LIFLIKSSERAGLFLDARSTASEARVKAQELKNLKNKLESHRQMELTEDNDENMVVQSNETMQGGCGIERYGMPIRRNASKIT
jgi:hypothetical protein